MTGKRKAAPARGTWSQPKRAKSKTSTNTQQENGQQQTDVQQPAQQGQQQGPSIQQQVADAVSQAMPAAIAAVIPAITQQVVDNMPQQGQSRDHGSSQPMDIEDEDLTETVQQHIDSLTSKTPVYSFIDEEEYSFTYNLTEQEIEKIAKLEYIDFSKVFYRVHRHAGSEAETGKKSSTLPEMTKDAWSLIFLAFFSEYARVFPAEASAMTKYMELILLMERNGMDWRRYDETFRINRAKKAHRGRASKLNSWATTDLELYLACNAAPKAASNQSKSRATSKSANQSSSQTAYDNIEKRTNTCWRFQAGDCKGACAWPDTHQCYRCEGGHPTKDCPRLREEKSARSERESFRDRERGSSRDRLSREESRNHYRNY